MSEERPQFILAGNGSYANRGCEAIVRGTTKILREHFRDPRFLCYSYFQSEEQYKEQCLKETDRAITHIASFDPHRLLSKQVMLRKLWKLEIWSATYQYFFNRDGFYARPYVDMASHLDDTTAVLSVGGDNYSLDYGVPVLFTALDNFVLKHGKPIVLWGASIGPFSAMPDYEQYMSRHLNEVTGIFARESVTVNYLKEMGVIENIYPVADPAFLMDPIKPVGVEDDLPIDEEAIGLNLSPLMAKYVTGGDLEAWASMAASIIAAVAREAEMPVYLIPHVTNSTLSDYDFMQQALSRIKNRNDSIVLVSPKYNAAETKWIISQMAFFAGARTHSTIAAISSCVPTLSFAYSIKAQGINWDCFGRTDYCINPKDLDAGAIPSRISSLLNESVMIRKELTNRVPKIQQAALNAGVGLKQLIGEN